MDAFATELHRIHHLFIEYSCKIYKLKLNNYAAGF